MYYVIQYFNILTKAMNLNQIILSFSDLFKTKKIVFTHLQRIIQDLYQISTQIPFSQRLSILTTVIYFLQRALTNQQASVDKLKYQIFYGVLKQGTENRGRSGHTTKKNNNRIGQRKKADITINQILQQAVSDGLAQLDNSIVPQINTKQGQNASKKEGVLPPFEAQVIAELTQDINLELKTPQKQAEMLEWQPSKLQNYQKWLALTQKGISITHQPRQAKTKKKHPQRQQVVIDDKIDITQGLSQAKMLQNLATKAKASRQFLQKQNRSFQSRIHNINPLLTGINKLANLQKLKIRYLNIQNKAIKQQSIKSQPNYNEADLNFYSIHQNKSQQSNASIKESCLNTTLRPKLTTLLKQMLVKTKKVTFQSICQSKMVEESKGQLFYQLLHLNFKLQQKEVSSFGNILISI